METTLLSLASFLGFVAFSACLGAAYVIIGAMWAASGSPDVNGDPERDAGIASETDLTTPATDWPDRTPSSPWDYVGED